VNEIRAFAAEHVEQYGPSEKDDIPHAMLTRIADALASYLPPEGA
jgi:hypothetical protein